MRRAESTGEHRAARAVVPIVVAFACAFAALAMPAAGNELQVDRSRIRIDQPLTIRVVLTGEAARADEIALPLSNLTVESGPSVSSHFEWVNGRSNRRKIFRYVVYGNEPGEAQIGPVVVEAGGRREILGPARVDILPRLEVGGGDPASVLRRLSAEGRQPVMIEAEADRARAAVGEPVVVSWWLYAADDLHGIRIAGSPALEDFWVEEFPVAEDLRQRIVVDGLVVQRILVRRAALYPLRSGTLEVGPLRVVAETMEGIGDPFGPLRLFNARVEEVRRSSEPIELQAEPVPEEADAVGVTSFRCTSPRLEASGPVVMVVTAHGNGNLRAAPAPRFVAPVDAAVEVEEGEVRVVRSGEAISMERRWKFVLFPNRRGILQIPPLQMTTWVPDSGRLLPMRCGGGEVEVVREAGDAELEAGELPPPPGQSRRQIGFAALAVAALAAFVVPLALRLRSRRVDPAAVGEITSLAGDPRKLRAAIHHLAAERGHSPDLLYTDASDAGDAFRAVISWIDMMEKEPESVRNPERELRKRVRELVRVLR